MYSAEQVNKSNDSKEYHLKRLAELSKDLAFVVPQLDEPNEEQKQWLKGKRVK